MKNIFFGWCQDFGWPGIVELTKKPVDNVAPTQYVILWLFQQNVWLVIRQISQIQSHATETAHIPPTI